VVSLARRGRASLGCLFFLLLVVTAGYFAFDWLDAYWRYYKLRDAMQTEARFAENYSDQMIRRHLRAKADSLGVPDDAVMRVRRTRGGIAIWTQYSEEVRLPMLEKTLTFSPVIRREF
jgi:hypothetical protein